MKIGIAGAGYVGLSLGVLLAQKNTVTIFDIIDEKIRLINSKKSPIRDKELEKYLAKKPLSLVATRDFSEAFSKVDYVIIATPTDYDDEKNFFDTESVCSTIEKVLAVNPNATIVIKSTIPVGFVEKMRKEHKTDNIFFSPEFLREGLALYDNLYPSRIVIGDHSEKAKRFSELLLEGAIKKDVPVLFTGPTEAEAIKLFANTYLALRIAYFNELDTYAELQGLNSKEIISGVCLDPRIGDYYNNPSFGYGGYCLPKDTKQLLANFNHTPQEIIKAVVTANKVRKKHIADSVLKSDAKRIGIYRLTMKKSSDNFRDSAIQDIIKSLKNSGRDILIYEPSCRDEGFDGVRVTRDLTEFKTFSDLIVANRFNDELRDVEDKVYTRDIFDRD